MEKNKKLIIGITGGIGTGKSMVLDILKNEYGALVIEADKIGHMVMKPEHKGYDFILNAFGESILKDDSYDGLTNEALNEKKLIDRGKLGDIVFNNKEKLHLLNSITHPLIYEEIKKIIDNSSEWLIALEAAILTETSLVELCDEIWYIYADRNVRIQRLACGRGIDKKKAESIMRNQPSDEEFKEKCHVVIDNSKDRLNTLLQIKENLPGGKEWEQ